MTSPKFSSSVRLFLDPQSLSSNNGSAVLRWRVENGGGSSLRELMLKLENPHRDPHIEILPNDVSEGRFTASGMAQWLTTSVKIKETGQFSFNISLSSIDEQGKKLSLVSTNPIVLGLMRKDDQAPVTITVEGLGLIKNVSSHGPLNIHARQDVLLKDMHFGSEAAQGNFLHHGSEQTNLDDLYEIQLCLPEIPGLYTLELEKLVSNWPESSPLLFDFVNERGHVVKEVKIHDRYRLKLKTYDKGVVTLIAQGTTGKFYFMVPSNLGVGLSALPKGEYFVPGKELLCLDNNPIDEQELYFGDMGDEKALVILSRSSLLDCVGDSLVPIERDLLIQILKMALEQRAQIRLAQVKVN